jgi:hypothetical protein
VGEIEPEKGGLRPFFVLTALKKDFDEALLAGITLTDLNIFAFRIAYWLTAYPDTTYLFSLLEGYNDLEVLSYYGVPESDVSYQYSFDENGDYLIYRYNVCTNHLGEQTFPYRKVSGFSTAMLTQQTTKAYFEGKTPTQEQSRVLEELEISQEYYPNIFDPHYLNADSEWILFPTWQQELTVDDIRYGTSLNVMPAGVLADHQLHAHGEQFSSFQFREHDEAHFAVMVANPLFTKVSPLLYKAIESLPDNSKTFDILEHLSPEASATLKLTNDKPSLKMICQLMSYMWEHEFFSHETDPLKHFESFGKLGYNKIGFKEYLSLTSFIEVLNAYGITQGDASADIDELMVKGLMGLFYLFHAAVEPTFVEIIENL